MCDLGGRVRRDSRLRRALVATAAVVTLAGGVAACTEQTQELPERVSPAPALPTAAPPPDLTADEQQAVEDVQAQVEEFLAAYLDLLVEGAAATEDQYGRLPQLGSGNLLFEVWDEVGANYDQDRRADGEIVWTFHEVVEVDLDRVITRGQNEFPLRWVQLRYCADATGFQVVDKASGQPTDPAEEAVMPAPGAHHQALFTVVMFLEEGDDRWRIEEWDNEEDRPC